jgi:DNA-binding MarR family transcriptional regulator
MFSKGKDVSPKMPGQPATKSNNSLESLADEIRALRDDLRFDAGAQLLFGGLLLNKYIDLRAKKRSQNRGRLDILHSLITHDGTLKPTELSKILFRSKQNITGIIDGLERDGLVRRDLAGKDRRTRRVVITSKGLEEVRTSLPTTLDVVKRGMPGLSEEEMHALGDILRKIIKYLTNEIKNLQ